MHTGLMFDPAYRRHLTGPHHPESPGRCDAIIEALQADGIETVLTHIASRAASDEEILLCHTRDYIKTAQSDIRSGRKALSTGDTAICETTWEIAMLAAGGVLNAVDAVV